MQKLAFILTLFLSTTYAQNNFTINGYVKEANSGEIVFGASIYIEGTTMAVVTNEYGYFSMQAPQGNFSLQISSLGFKTIVEEINLNQNLTFDFKLENETTDLKEVVVKATREITNLKKPQMSVNKVSIKTIKKIPVVLSEVDIIKSILLLPGVTNSGEGSGGFNVRGGAEDQNLVLLDEAIIYNSSHLFGLFSIFNADAIRDLKLYKGNIPAKYGGRVSSVLDVRQRDGNNQEYEFSAGISPVSSRFAVEGPIAINKSSFLLTGRRSFVDVFLKASGQENFANFYDLNLKLNYNIDEKNKIYLSGYTGRDNFTLAGTLKNGYGNHSANLRWNHLFNKKLFSNLSLIYSKYNYDFELTFLEFDWNSSVKNFNLKYDFKYYLNSKIDLDFGVNSIYFNFNPGIINPTTSTSAILRDQLDKKFGLENSLYVNVAHELSEKISANYGLRFSNFVRLGGQTLQDYENNLPVVYNPELDIYERGITIGETNYSSGKSISSFNNLEPRLGLSYQLNDDSSVKAGYSRTAQYIHLLSNTQNVTPLDVWTPSGKYIKPQLSDQYSIGYFKDLKKSKLSLEAEAYYKTVDNRIDYIDGASLIAQNEIETQILNGESRSYGLELLLRKTSGNLTGFASYTLAKAEQRTLGGAAGGPGINNGDWYLANQDRTHDFSLTTSYELNKKWSFGGNLILQTGRPVTLPNQQYVYEDVSVLNYSNRNESRLPSYHRIDVSANYKPKRDTKKWEDEWVFSIYNIYNRMNAASISVSQNAGTGQNEALRTAIFGIVPSFSYNFKF
jgi:hypothetical protein